MKKVIFALAILTLTACGEEETTIQLSETETQIIKIKDAKNLNFEKIDAENSNKPLNNPPVVNDTKCSTEKKPVCGKIKNNLNGYLNKCEAERHGAEIISEGFCKLEAQKKEKCETEFLTQGNCMAYFEGFTFNKTSKTCEKKSGSGCNAQIPFDSEESCKKSCQ